MKNLFINSYNKFIEKGPCKRIISEKVAWQTEVATVSELFCVEDSKSNHEKTKEPGLFKEKVSVILKI